MSPASDHYTGVCAAPDDASSADAVTSLAGADPPATMVDLVQSPHIYPLRY